MSTIKSSAENLTLNADGANNDVIIQSNASTKVTVDGATGNVGVGTASPDGKLHLYTDNVNTASSDADDFIIEKTGDAGLSILSTTTGRVYFGDAASTDQGSIRYIHSDNSMRFETDSSERVRILSSGGITFNGDTAAANALDDYEEGTWTPVFRGSTTAGTYSYAVQNGYYTKIGRLVTVTCSLFNIDDAGGAGAGNIEIAGLPFTSSDDTHRGMIGTLELDNFTFSGSLSVTAENTTTYVILRASSSGAGDYVLLVGARDSDGSDLCFSLTYQV